MKKFFKVNIDMVWSRDFNVSAKNLTEAKEVAWEKYKKQLKKGWFKIYADER